MKNKEHYVSIRVWKDENIFSFLASQELNSFHDEVMKKVFSQALQVTSSEFGEPPCDYSWFVVGSAGRFEQGFISDQDHGLVYNSDDPDAEVYFQELGKEISYGLYEAGYPYCEGKVMSSNPTWCRSLTKWEEQLGNWAEEASLETIRYLQILFDARNMFGNSEYARYLKEYLFKLVRQNPQLIKRFIETISHIKHSVGIFGQLFVESSGPHEGLLDIKQSAFTPYVNSIRLMAIKEEILESSTLMRIEELLKYKVYAECFKNYAENFQLLLSYRLYFSQGVKEYQDAHFLHVKKLTKAEKRAIRNIIKDGEKLHQYVQNQIKGVENGL